MRFISGGHEVTSNLRAGLALTESDEWTLPAIMWDDELPDILSLQIEGVCTNASRRAPAGLPVGRPRPVTAAVL